MFCGECGKKVKAGDLFCEHCGAKIEIEKEEETETENKNTIQKFKDENSKNESKPMDPKKKKQIMIISGVIILLFGLYYCIGILTGPKKLAEKYFNATIKNDVEELYDFFEFEKTELNNKKMFKKVINNTKKETNKIEITNYEIGEPIYEDMNMKVTVPITYHEKGQNNNKNIEVELYKSKEKKWLIFDKWVIETLGNDMIKEFQIKCPKNSNVTFEGLKINKYLNKEKSTKLYDVYILKNIFRGKYNVETKLPFELDIKDLVYANGYSVYTPYVNKSTISEKSKDRLTKLGKDDVQKIYSNIIEGKKFSDIKNQYEFKNSDLNYLENRYNSMFNSLTKYQKLKELQINSAELYSVNYNLEEEEIRISLDLKYKYKIEYNYYDKKEVESTTNNRVNLTYKIVDGQLKITEAYYLKSYF